MVDWRCEWNLDVTLSASVISDVHSAAADAELSFVIEWDDAPALSAAADKPTRREKHAAMMSALARLKAPLISELSRFDNVDVHDIVGSNNAVVLAPADVWRKLIDQPVFRNADVRLNPNERFYAD